MTEADMVTLLSHKFSPPDWGFISKVRNQTGYANMSDGIRTADALAMGLWPSRGMDLIGFEIKCSRGDWITELKNASKADAIARYCDCWYIAADKNVVKKEELPNGWGLIEPSGPGLKIVVSAARIEKLPMTNLFLAGIFRAIDENVVQKSEVQQMIKREVEAKVNSKEWNAKYRVENCEGIEKKIKKFEEITGVQLQYFWNDSQAVDWKQAIMLVESKGSSDELKRLYRLKEVALDIAADIDKKLSNKSL